MVNKLKDEEVVNVLDVFKYSQNYKVCFIDMSLQSRRKTNYIFTLQNISKLKIPTLINK